MSTKQPEKNAPRLVVIVGPTASGKTALAVSLAKKYHGEIISADSRQIYRGMDIGTAKPTQTEQRRIRHWLINIKKPNQSFTLAHFQKNANQTIQKIIKRGKLPFLVGGTGFYIHALLNNLNIPEVKPNQKLRRRLEKFSLRKLFTLLKKLDPKRAKTIDRMNPRRLIRALEIAKTMGQISAMQTPSRNLTSTLVLGLKISKTRLRQSINRRVDLMIKQGLVAEVNKLIKRHGRHKIFLQTIGYAEIIRHLDGELTLPEATAAIKKNTWHYTKHQYNWFRRLPVIWIKNQKQAGTEIKKFLS